MLFSMRTPGLPLLCFLSMQFLKINILQGSVVTLLGVMTYVMTSLLQISCGCNSEGILKNGPTLLKYPLEYTAYFFEPPCMYRIVLYVPCRMHACCAWGKAPCVNLLTKNCTNMVVLHFCCWMLIRVVWVYLNSIFCGGLIKTHLFCNRMRIGLSRPSEVADFSTNLKGVCDFPLLIDSNFGSILHRFWDTASYWLKLANFFYPTLI